MITERNTLTCISAIPRYFGICHAFQFERSLMTGWVIKQHHFGAAKHGYETFSIMNKKKRVNSW